MLLHHHMLGEKATDYHSEFWPSSHIWPSHIWPSHLPHGSEGSQPSSPRTLIFRALNTWWDCRQTERNPTRQLRLALFFTFLVSHDLWNEGCELEGEKKLIFFLPKSNFFDTFFCSKNPEFFSSQKTFFFVLKKDQMAHRFGGKHRYHNNAVSIKLAISLKGVCVRGGVKNLGPKISQTILNCFRWAEKSLRYLRSGARGPKSIISNFFFVCFCGKWPLSHKFWRGVVVKTSFEISQTLWAPSGRCCRL